MTCYLSLTNMFNKLYIMATVDYHLRVCYILVAADEIVNELKNYRKSTASTMDIMDNFNDFQSTCNLMRLIDEMRESDSFEESKKIMKKIYSYIHDKANKNIVEHFKSKNFAIFNE